MSFLQQAALFLARLTSLYSFLIWLRIMLSWVNPYPREGTMTWYLGKIVDPWLNLFRRRGFTVGMIDFSPVLAIAVLSIIQSLLSLFGATGTLRLGWVLAMVLEYLWAYGFSLFFTILTVLLVVRLIGSLSRGGMMSRMTGVTENYVRRLHRFFFPNRIVKETTMNVVALVTTILLWLITWIAFDFLLALCYRIPF